MPQVQGSSFLDASIEARREPPLPLDRLKGPQSVLKTRPVLNRQLTFTITIAALYRHSHKDDPRTREEFYSVKVLPNWIPSPFLIRKQSKLEESREQISGRRGFIRTSVSNQNFSGNCR